MRSPRSVAVAATAAFAVALLVALPGADAAHDHMADMRCGPGPGVIASGLYFHGRVTDVSTTPSSPYWTLDIDHVRGRKLWVWIQTAELPEFGDLSRFLNTTVCLQGV